MLPQKFYIRNVDIWNATGVQKAKDLLVEECVVKNIQDTNVFKPQERDTVFEGEGKVLMPAGVDVQVHLRVPGQRHKEIPETGLKAALRGGYGAVLIMPNTNPVIDSVEVCELAKKECANAERVTGVHVYLSAAMTKGQLGIEVVDAAPLVKWGVKALTDDGKGVQSDSVMETLFKISEELGGIPLLQHAEFPGHGGVLAPGPAQKSLGVAPYSAEAEWSMVERDLKLLETHPRARYHVLHISSAKSVDLLRVARAKGLQASGELSPHHMYFSADDIKTHDSSFKMNPPLRSAQDRSQLFNALKNKDISFVATDHAPHEPALKGQDFSAAAWGTTGLETALRVLLDFYSRGELSPERIVEVFSLEPAKFLKIDDEFGRISVGFPLRAVWLDPKAPPSVIQEGDLESLSKNNCFIGSPLAGHIFGVFNESGFFRF